MAWLNPDQIPTSLFGRVGDLAITTGKDYPDLARQLALGVYAIHLLEASICLYLCQQLKLKISTTIAWLIQTLFLGMLALRFLIWPRKEVKSNTTNDKEE